MPAEDILRVVITISVTQIVLDVLATKLVYEKEPYQRLVGSFERAKAKYLKLEAQYATKSEKQQEKMAKQLQRAKDDMGEAKSAVASKHSGPGIYMSIIYMILFRILGAEHSGKVFGILPFEPWTLLRKVTMRGLDFGNELGTDVFKDSKGLDSVNSACSFVIIYLLCNMGVKFYVHKLVGESPPPGAEGGLFAVMESPAMNRSLKQLGLNPDEFKEKYA